MTISANTLFHFTTQFDYLKKILEGEIAPRYCMEFFGFITDQNLQYIAIPMFCFCDLPLSQITNHIGNYGKFAIGMTKEWAQKNGITPVQYVTEKAEIASYINSQVESTRNSLSIRPNSPKNHVPIAPDNFHQIINSIAHQISYIKPVKGNMYKDSKLKRNIESTPKSRRDNLVDNFLQ